MTSVHERINLKPCEPNPEQVSSTILSARDLASSEAQRAAEGGLDEAGPRVPCDIILWADGEPSLRAVTKLGGVPHRPRTAPWPRSVQGSAAQFIGQICFADSRDILVDEKGGRLALPGDVLLIFGTSREWVESMDVDALTYEWQPLELADPATTVPELIPEASFGERRPWDAMQPVYARLCRTYDLPSVPDEHPLRGDDNLWLDVYNASKIGGSPCFLQSDDGPGTFLGQFVEFGAPGTNGFMSFYVWLVGDEVHFTMES